MKKIIHFTKKYDSLESILKSSSFKIFYCKEDFSVRGILKSRAAHPMVCFSHFESDENIPIKSSYGSYGIEFSEEWAISKKIIPVIYIEENNQLSKALENLLIARRNEKLNKKLAMSIMLIKCYTKNLIGKNSNQNNEKYSFKNENEWRFVPTKKEIGGNFISLNRKNYIENKEKYNNLVSKYSLNFKLLEIRKIYVSNDEEKKNIHKNFKIKLEDIIVNK
ncbi:TPA: abortive infection system antitoxin AbiGi family protein [Flavobacterium psychrophilum]